LIKTPNEQNWYMIIVDWCSCGKVEGFMGESDWSYVWLEELDGQTFFGYLEFWLRYVWCGPYGRNEIDVRLWMWRLEGTGIS